MSLTTELNTGITRKKYISDKGEEEMTTKQD